MSTDLFGAAPVAKHPPRHIRGAAKLVTPELIPDAEQIVVDPVQQAAEAAQEVRLNLAQEIWDHLEWQHKTACFARERFPKSEIALRQMSAALIAQFPGRNGVNTRARDRERLAAVGVVLNG